jgi:soluble lytic murein transglycosylase-like protein
MSECKGWLWLIAGVTLAYHVTLPETLVYHGARLTTTALTPSKVLLESEVDRAADAYGLQRAVLRALVRVESAYNPKAVSKVGARGLSQVMPFNAARCGLDAKHLFDPTYNVRCGAQILREELDQYGDLQKALTVYNCGKVKCAEGQRYAAKVISLAKLY